MNTEKTNQVIGQPLVSIIIPVYNVEKYLKASIESARKQTYKNTEIILIDDGSTDKSPDICDNYDRKYTNIKVLHQKNGGLSAARNAGIKMMSEHAVYLLFLDSDDVLLEDAISGMVSKADDEKADMVIPDRYIKVKEETNKETLAYHFMPRHYYDEPVEFALNVLVANGRGWRAHSLLYRTAPIKEHNVCFPVGYTAEDFVFNLKVLVKVKKIAFYSSPTVRYLKRKGSITTTFNRNFAGTIWYLNSEVQQFYKESGVLDNGDAKKKRESLLARNVIIYIQSIMSRVNSMTRKQKLEFAQTFLESQEIKGLFQKSLIIPYFQNPFKLIYYKILLILLRFNNKRCALLLSYYVCKFF